ncbi:hypothetical protein V1264_002309 [Littorina saxatilis]|uniref:Uncharacterized protein n=1 Tax=Littorina saxatilis TaxID=31220 RepID=A0AAN9GQ36_9CAEN
MKHIINKISLEEKALQDTMLQSFKLILSLLLNQIHHALPQTDSEVGQGNHPTRAHRTQKKKKKNPTRDAGDSDLSWRSGTASMQFQ